MLELVLKRRRHEEGWCEGITGRRGRKTQVGPRAEGSQRQGSGGVGHGYQSLGRQAGLKRAEPGTPESQGALGDGQLLPSPSRGAFLWLLHCMQTRESPWSSSPALPGAQGLSPRGSGEQPEGTREGLQLRGIWRKTLSCILARQLSRDCPSLTPMCVPSDPIGTRATVLHWSREG